MKPTRRETLFTALVMLLALYAVMALTPPIRGIMPYKVSTMLFQVNR